MKNVTVTFSVPKSIYEWPLAYCFLFFSVIVTLFDVSFCIFKLKDFNCSNSIRTPFPSLTWVIWDTVSLWNREAMHI